MTEIEQIDSMLASLKSLKSTIKQYEKARDKAGSMNMRDNTPTQMANAEIRMATLARAVTTEKVQICRKFEKSSINIGTEERTTNATGWQKQVI